MGEIRRLRSETITFVPVPPNFAEVLERRCQGLLDAQSAYSDAMRSYDAHWAAMSGYRVGELYQTLHRDLHAIPPPRGATDTEKKRLFQGAMSLRYRVLLEKGLKLMEHTVMIGERTGEGSSWIERARDAKRQLEKALNQEKEQLAKLPYSESQLEKALQDLASSRPVKKRQLPFPRLIREGTALTDADNPLQTCLSSRGTKKHSALEKPGDLAKRAQILLDIAERQTQPPCPSAGPPALFARRPNYPSANRRRGPRYLRRGASFACAQVPRRLFYAPQKCRAVWLGLA